jgi:hypothetical protein
MGESKNVNEVRVGDRIRISVELIRQIQEMEAGRSELVELKEVRVSEDGTRVLYLSKVPEAW